MSIAGIDAVADYLVAQNIGGGATGWTVSRGTFTDAVKDIAVMDSGGAPPLQQAAGRVLYQGAVIQVRGEPGAAWAARQKAEAVLTTLDGASVSGLLYLHVTQSSPMDVGPDESGRPLFSLSFRGQDR